MARSVRQIKVECNNPECGFIFRTSELQLAKLFNKYLDRPWCPACDTGNLYRSEPKQEKAA